MKNYRIRREQPSDFAHIHTLIKTAFATADYSDQQEQFLVERLRQDPAFLPKLALVAEHENGQIIGHIVFSQALINDTKVLALAPLSVHPNYQKQGVGAALIQHAHKFIQALDYPAVVVLGYSDYYAKFGYQHVGRLGLTAPFDVPDGALRVWVLSDTTYDTLNVEIQYADAFFG